MNRWTHHIIRVSGVYEMTLIFLALLLSSGCGKKTLPRPITEQEPPQVRDLKAEVRGSGVELTWSAPEGMKDTSYRYVVVRSQVDWEKRNCLDCPVPEREILQTIDPAYPKGASVKDKRFVWLDTEVSHARAYRYQVDIQDAKDRLVSASNPVAVKVMPPPQAPTDLRAVREQDGILLQWKAPGKNQQGRRLQGKLSYVVERHSPQGPWERISPVPIKGSTFFDQTVVSSELYDYRVLSALDFEDTIIWSEPSAVRQIRAPDALPPPPPDTVWVVPGKGTLEVYWTESDGRVGGYHVYRREGKEITRLTSTPVERPPYMDRSAKPDSVYFYAVSAVNPKPDLREGLLSKWVEMRNVFFQ